MLGGGVGGGAAQRELEAITPELSSGWCSQPALGEELSRQRDQKIQVPVFREPGLTTFSFSQCTQRAGWLSVWSRTGSHVPAGL